MTTVFSWQPRFAQPDLERCDHTVTVRYDPVESVTIYQHGENPEAVLWVHDWEMAAYPGDWREIVSDWLKRVHADEKREAPVP